MKRLLRSFSRIHRRRRCGLIAYVTCGDPSPEGTVEVARELERAGAMALELGVPFSDPIADGPVIQAASQRALQRGTTVADLFAIARRIRKQSEIPLIAFSYLNPILAYGLERFASAATAAGIDAALITDLPPESAKPIRDAFRSRGVGTIFLAAPTSPDRRLKLVERMSDGFVYYVSVTGVTGAREALDPALIARLREVRKVIRKPLAVGFGISRHEHYAMLAPLCDAVVVGSAIVRVVGESDPRRAAARAGELVHAILGR
jgi:tryptophan synthase alpha chain